MEMHLLQRAFKHHTLIVALLLKLASNIVENHVSYLKPEEVGVLLQWVLVLLQQYAEDNQWVKEGTAAKSLVVRVSRISQQEILVVILQADSAAMPLCACTYLLFICLGASI
jgi:hypothetical protein